MALLAEVEARWAEETCEYEALAEQLAAEDDADGEYGGIGGDENEQLMAREAPGVLLDIEQQQIRSGAMLLIV
jgi:hypothetical protein